jgi:hypothetical protein
MNKKGAEMDSLSKARWDFFIRCWEYNIKIWKPTFLENRLNSPLLYKTFDQVLIPYFGKIAGFYYGLTRGQQLKQAFWTLSMPQQINRKVRDKISI